MGKITDKRVKRYINNLRKMIEQHLNHPMWGAGSLEDRVKFQYEEQHLEWLESFCKGIGYNMGCGEIPVGDSIGVDLIQVLGIYNNDFMCDMENTNGIKDESADYIISNYIEAARCPTLMFIGWCRILKKEGKLAILCRNADAYPSNSFGGLQRSAKGNVKKFSCYTPKTIKFYLQFAGFQIDQIDEIDEIIRVEAHKL